MYLGSDFRSILTGMVSIDARGRVGVQEVKKRQICENKNRKTRERVGVQQQKIPCLVSHLVEIGFCPYFSSKILFPGAVRKATRGSFDRAWSSVAEKLLLAQIVRRTMWMGSTGLCRIRTRCQTCLLLLKHYEN